LSLLNARLRKTGYGGRAFYPGKRRCLNCGSGFNSEVTGQNAGELEGG
jgi:hypothetical protein